MDRPARHLRVKAQLFNGVEIAMGPGKADLLEAIAVTGSISGAGRRLGFSYRRTWLLVDTMNRCWRTPLVATAHGGAVGGGARLTELGGAVLARFRALEAALATASAEAAATLVADLAEAPRPAGKA